MPLSGFQWFHTFQSSSSEVSPEQLEPLKRIEPLDLSRRNGAAFEKEQRC
jgi:hypothetical protein